MHQVFFAYSFLTTCIYISKKKILQSTSAILKLTQHLLRNQSCELNIMLHVFLFQNTESVVLRMFM